MALNDIVAQKRIDVERRKTITSAGVLRQGLGPSDRSLKAALQKPHPSFILEFKKSSPSKGLIRPSFDIEEIANAYAPFADAVSVITDEPFFQGRLDYLRQVRERVTQPVLCKDFVVDPYQVIEARAHGADAILLMLSVLDDETYDSCAKLASELQLDTLTEVHTEHELQRAIQLKAPIIGINNRDLHTLRIDMDTMQHLARRVPADRLIVCESGIRTHEDVIRNRDRVDGFLVGSSLMARPDIDHAVRELIFGRSKVCGMTSVHAANTVWNAGACWGGLIFYPGSERAIQPDIAFDVMQKVPQLHWAGVFVDHTPDQIVKISRDLNLNAVQLHGDYNKIDIGRIHAQIDTNCAIWSRWAPEPGTSPPSKCPESVDKLICDPKSKTRLGGTGIRFDWNVLKPLHKRDHLIIAGGLSPENAAAADLLSVWALDVNSGVESSPGVKSPELVASFFKALRGKSRGSHL